MMKKQISITFQRARAPLLREALDLLVALITMIPRCSSNGTE